MRKSKNEKAPPEQKEVALETVRTNIIKAISEQYDMNVNQFCNSEFPAKLGLSGKNIAVYLSSGGTVSSPVFIKLYKFLNLGELKSEVKVKKEIHFYEGES